MGLKKTPRKITFRKNPKNENEESDNDDSFLNKDDVGEKEDTYDIEASDDEIEEDSRKWYNEFPYVKLPKKDCTPNEVESFTREAEMVLNDEANNFRKFLEVNKKSETQWMMTVAKSGTSTDKVAALALMVHESPIHSLSSLSSLVNMAKPSKKHQFMAVLDTLTELFITDLLRPAKKLRKLHKQPLAHLAELCGDDNSARRKRLCYWLFEEKLKTLYEQFIGLLIAAAQDSVQNNREKAIGALLKLLLANREQEDVIISSLINKFGDPVHKVSSRVVYGLEKVAHRHPKMKEHILDEVEKMLFRTHISKRAQYYGICFLSQYRFSASDKELCKRLITLYFSFFKSCVKTGDIDSRLMGALLVGVNRAYPYASRGVKSETVIPMEHIDTMYKVVHFAPFKISLQALALLLQISHNDRVYNTLYRKLFDKELLNTSHQAIWLNLMIKAIRKDENESRKKAFVKRILQICLYSPVPLLCGTLMMVSQIVKHLPDVHPNFDFVKEEPEEAEEATTFPDILSNLKKFENDGDGEEKVVDAKLEGEETFDVVKPESSVGSSWFHRDLVPAPQMNEFPVEKKFKPPTAYDPTHRNPAFAGGDKATFVELETLSRHFHPTVSLFAKKIIAGERIHYTGDPLKDFTTLHFLERFSFKNPKKSKRDRGEEKQELFRAVGSERKHYNPTGMRALPIQSDLYLKQSESAVPVDEMFLYKYLKEKQSKSETKSKPVRKRDGDSDDESDISDTESVGSIEFNEYLDNIMTGKRSADALDFAEDVENAQKNKKQKKDEDEESDDDDEMDDEEGGAMSDGEEGVLEDDGDENEKEDDDDDDDGEDTNSIEDFDADSEDDENDLDVPESEEDEDEKKMDLQSALRQRISRDFGSSAVPLEQFSEMLEETGRSKSGGTHDIFNKDKASDKQLKWESSRMKQRWRTKNVQKGGGKSNTSRNPKYKRDKNSKWSNNKNFKNKKF